jgi:hypothetical protein
MSSILNFGGCDMLDTCNEPILQYWPEMNRGITVDSEILGSRVCGGSKIAKNFKKEKIRKMLDSLTCF